MKVRKLAWPFGFYFLIFAGVASYRPYMVLYYQSLSFTGTQIGLLTGIAPLIPLVSLPLMTGFADRTNRHKLIMGVSLLGIVSALIFFPYLEIFIPLLILAILTTVFFSPIGSLANSASMFMLGDRRDLFGRIRLGGTLGFSIFATLAGVLVEQNGLRVAFWCAAGLFFIAFLASLKLEYGSEESGEAAKKGRATELLKNPHFLLFMLLGLSGGISFATLNTYLFPYMKELGAGESVMGLALTIGTIAEVPILFFANRFIQRFQAYPVLIFSVAMTILRFFLLAVAPGPTFVLLIQLLNGFNQPLMTVAGVIYADQLAPSGFRATAQGLFNVAYGALGAAVGGFVGGLLIESIGARGMYLVFCLFVAIALVFVAVVRRTLPTEQPAGTAIHMTF